MRVSVDACLLACLACGCAVRHALWVLCALVHVCDVHQAVSPATSLALPLLMPCTREAQPNGHRRYFISLRAVTPSDNDPVHWWCAIDHAERVYMARTHSNNRWGPVLQGPWGGNLDQPGDGACLLRTKGAPLFAPHGAKHAVRASVGHLEAYACTWSRRCERRPHGSASACTAYFLFLHA